MKKLSSLIVASMISARIVAAQDPVEVAPGSYSVLLDNENVRALDVHVARGATIPMHDHPDCVIYHIGPSKEKHTFGDGRVEEHEFKGGETAFAEAFSHSAENTGTNDIHVLVVELKAAPAGSVAAAADKDPAALDPSVYHVAYDSDRVRVLDVHIVSGGVVRMHSHPACVVYHVTASSERHTLGDGKIEVRDFRGGECEFIPPFSHKAENVGEDDLHVVVVELKSGAPAASAEKPAAK